MFLILTLRVTPKGSRNEWLPYQDGEAFLRVKVTSPPEDGKANTAVLSLLSDTLNLPKRDITLLSGETSRIKRVLLTLDNDKTTQIITQIASLASTTAETSPFWVKHEVSR